MARRGFVRTGRVSEKRLTQWVGSADISTQVALAAGAAVLDQSLVLTGLPATVVRTRGIITVYSDQTAANEEPFGAIGMCVVSDQALAIGVTAVPTPITDSGSDLFFLHQYFAAPVKATTDIAFANVSQTYGFDSKAMRKISEDESLIIVVENASATAGLNYLLQFRMLIKVN